MQLSLLGIEQHQLLLIAVAHKFMQLIKHNKRRNHRRRSFVGHTLMALVQLVAHYSFSITYNSCTLIVVNGEHRRN